MRVHIPDSLSAYIAGRMSVTHSHSLQTNYYISCNTLNIPSFANGTKVVNRCVFSLEGRKGITKSTTNSVLCTCTCMYIVCVIRSLQVYGGYVGLNYSV